MKTILLITGSRKITDLVYIHDKLDKFAVGKDIAGMIEGEAEGVDKICSQWANLHSIPLYPFRVTNEDWAKYPSYAGNIRNGEMVKFALQTQQKGEVEVVCVAFWDGKSTGTSDMVSKARKAGLPVVVHNPLSPFRR